MPVLMRAGGGSCRMPPPRAARGQRWPSESVGRVEGTALALRVSRRQSESRTCCRGPRVRVRCSCAARVCVCGALVRPACACAVLLCGPRVRVRCSCPARALRVRVRCSCAARVCVCGALVRPACACAVLLCGPRVRVRCSCPARALRVRVRCSCARAVQWWLGPGAAPRHGPDAAGDSGRACKWVSVARWASTTPNQG